MEEKEEINNKLIKHLIYNIIGFSAIFIVFGVFIFLMVKNTTYKRIDNELKDNKSMILQENKQSLNDSFDKRLIEEFIDKNNWVIKDIFLETEDNLILRRIKNPNIIVVIRNYNDGKIHNEDSLGRLKDFSSEIPFDSNYLNNIYEASIGDNYYYRGISFIYDREDISESKYIQLLINIDGEKDLINNYFKIIIYAVTVGIMLSILASYVLSKKTLKPLRENLENQTEFVQNVSHELRTPLTIIQAKQELLLQEPNAKIVDKLEDIILTLNETKRLTKLVKDLMILSRGDGDNIKLQKESINVDEYIKEITAPYSELAKIQNKRIIYNLNYNMDIEIDSSRFYQLVVILVDNAMKYTEENDLIEIATYVKENKFVLEIKDTGIGVSEEGLKRIFERFYREDKTRNRETGGSGLGLSIANLIVTAHGGTIKAGHNNPKGTIFTVKLPK